MWFISMIGLFLVIFGELLRKAAMFWAGQNFNHYVQHVREEGHQLVTDGVYNLFRHPSYVGWFYWSVGTQVFIHLFCPDIPKLVITVNLVYFISEAICI